jgi:pyruvate formate lyase activating enzyme
VRPVAEPADVVGRVHSWDTSIGVDGPGTRLVVFTAGCPLRCLYCHNPDTWSGRAGRPMPVSAVLAEVDRYARFLRVAGGGVTVSGGEPLLQPAFVEALLAGCRDRGLHTALDTSGYLGRRATDHLLDNTDLVLLDIKSWDPATYRALTGGEVGPTLDFARRLADRGRPVWVRFVLVPGWTDEPANVAGIARFCVDLGNVERVDVLPFHRLGQPKYAALGLPYPLADTVPPDPALLARVRDQFADAGLAVR